MSNIMNHSTTDSDLPTSDVSEDIVPTSDLASMLLFSAANIRRTQIMPTDRRHDYLYFLTKTTNNCLYTGNGHASASAARAKN